MKNLLRSLVPRSPWCAAAAAWCGLAILTADAVLLAVGIRPRLEIVDELRHVCPETSVAIVGDCNNVAGTICEAVNQAFQACLHI